MCDSSSSQKLWVMHFVDLPLQLFLDSFLHPTVLTLSSKAEIISEIFSSFIFLEII